MRKQENDLKLEGRARPHGQHWLKRIVLLVFILLANFLYRNSSILIFQKKDHKEIHGHSSFTLRDGSKGIVWATGLISYDNAEFNKRLREITATGDVYIDIQEDAERPFIVHCEGGLIVRSHGGAFEKKVDAGDGHVRVLVGEGNVEILGASGKLVGYLRKGEEAILHAGTSDVKIKKHDDVVIGENGIDAFLRFENITVAEVAIRLQSHFGVEVRVSPAIQECTIYASFYIEDLAITTVLDVIQKSLRDMEYRVIPDERGNIEKVKITGRGCGNTLQHMPGRVGR
jgi:ferric-dicitrate binding protein FerR (iron transport regulator)